MNMYDMTPIKETFDKVGIKQTGQKITINNSQIPEIEDFKIDDEVEMNIKCKVTKISKPEFDDTGKEEKADEKIEATLEIVTAGITNEKPVRKAANERGLDKKEWEKIQQKRRVNTVE